MVRATDAAGLVTIAQLKPIFVSFTLPQEHLHKMREKQAKAPLEVLAYGDDNKTPLADGKLTLIDNVIDQATGTIRLKATFDNADERLWPGEFVNVRLVVNMRKGVPTVPAQTVQDGPNGHTPMSSRTTTRSSGALSRSPRCRTASRSSRKGLSPGEKVVVEGQYRLTNGARVRIAAPKAAGDRARSDAAG